LWRAIPLDYFICTRGQDLHFLPTRLDKNQAAYGRLLGFDSR
jgi:hypothetical protein